MCATLTYFEVKAEPSFVSLPISKIRHVVLYDVTSSHFEGADTLSDIVPCLSSS